ncbi:TRAP transporter large permease [Devosia sp.]|uniref:TRAP transporter large permease n=1 Tax=Devosia sp. TaxID=1871048 RepID=UPI002AFF8629|nr:TRAP transporter large permease [Devosia sp.]
MSPTLIGLLGIAALFGLMLFRTPIAFAMLIVGFFGYAILRDFNSATALLLTESYSTVSSFTLIVVPMFILLGNISSAAGFSRGLYDAANAWIGRLPGGLASASVLGCAAFSAVSGSSVATALTIGKVAMPEMRRLGYADGLAAGSVAAGGTLGFLIPPSTAFILYAILTEESIGRLFMAGILPGLLMTLLFVIAVWLVVLFRPEAGPRGEALPLKAKLLTLVDSVPLVGIIVVSIGGIYIGAFTPVEASGIGAGLVILLAVLRGKLSWDGFKTASLETLKSSAMLYFIVISANVLNPFFAMTQIPQLLGDGLTSFGLGAYATLFVIILFYILLGMFMDELAMIVLTIPIVYPIIIALGFDPIWFGVILVIVVQMGLIAPPVGLNVFVVRSVVPEVPLLTIYRGVMPFLLAMMAALLLIIIFPQIALMIPNSMFGN